MTQHCVSPAGKRGSITLVTMLMLLVLLVFGFILLDWWKEAVLKRQGMAIAEAVALEGLRLSRLPEYTPPGYVPYTPGNLYAPDIWQRLQWIALKNGLGDLWFHPLETTDIEQGPNWVAVTVQAKDTDMVPIKATAVGFPTWTVGEGAAWFTDANDVEGVTGVLPIGVQTSVFAGASSDVLSGAASFLVRVAADLNFEAQPLQLLGGPANPAANLNYLAYDPPPGNALNGTPPPLVKVGDQVVIVFRLGPPGQNKPPGGNHLDLFSSFADDMSNIVGRTAIVPLLDGDTVVDFAQLRVEASVKVVSTGNGGGGGNGGITPPPNPGHGGTPPGHGGTVPGLGPGVFLGAVDVVFRVMPSQVARSTYRHPDQPLVNPYTVSTMGRVLRPSIWTNQD